MCNSLVDAVVFGDLVQKCFLLSLIGLFSFAASLFYLNNKYLFLRFYIGLALEQSFVKCDSDAPALWVFQCGLQFAINGSRVTWRQR